MLELAILGLLKELPLHGYELKKRLNETLGHWGVSYGSLYPALARLERLGAIEVANPAPAAAAAPIPATGSISGEAAAARLRRLPLKSGGRTRKAYRLAAPGHELFAQLFRSEVAPGTDEERVFALKLAFCGHLEPSARLELLQRRREQLAAKRNKGRETLAAIGRGKPGASRPRMSDRYTRAVIEHEANAAERDLEWVDSLIQQETESANLQNATPQVQGGTP